jgi:anti-sigma factor RsiW
MMNGFRDIELLSSYMDGQLGPSDSARLESRLQSDPQLAAAFEDLRAARGILRRLPARKAPRNFTLTRKMVGAKPPMPPGYSFFRFSSALATVLLVMTYTLNLLSGIGAGTAAFHPQSGGGGAGQGDPGIMMAPAATEAPIMPDQPAMESAPLATQVAPLAAGDTSREMETPTPEAALPKDTQDDAQSGMQSEEPDPASFAPSWQVWLLVIALVSALIAFMMNQLARRKWR